MIWNLLKQIFWCGVFHETTFLDESSPYYRGNPMICAQCWTEFEVLK